MSEDLQDALQVLVSQNQQMIDILMMLLQEASPSSCALVDYIHNTKNTFLSDMTEAELAQAIQTVSG